MLMSEFHTAYLESMKRVNADNFYKFPLEYFTELSHALGDRLHLCVVEIDGQLASGALFVECCGIVQGTLTGTIDSFYKLHPFKTILNFVRYWAKDRGNQCTTSVVAWVVRRMRRSTSKQGSPRSDIPSRLGGSSLMKIVMRISSSVGGRSGDPRRTALKVSSPHTESHSKIRT